MPWFLSDPHFGHDVIRHKCHRPFETVEQMNRVLIENWNRLIAPKDEVYLLGDVFLKMSQKEALAIREQLHGNIYLITGNHDQIAKSIPRAWGWVKESYLFTTKTDPITFEPKNIAIYLHHFAHRTWPKSHKGSWHLYGHSHGNLPHDPHLLSMDVGVDVWGFEPVSLFQVAQSMAAIEQKRVQLCAFMDELIVLEEQANFIHRINERVTPGTDPHRMQIDPQLVLRLIHAARGAQPEVRK